MILEHAIAEGDAVPSCAMSTQLPNRADLLRLHLVRGVLVACAAGCASAPSHSAVGFPQPAVGIVAYETDVAFNLDDASLAARSMLSFAASDSAPARVKLLLNRGLEVREVRGPTVRSFRIDASELSPIWNIVSVALDAAVIPGTIVSLSISYAGRPTISSDSINRISRGWVELSLDSGWHPIPATFDQDMIGSLRITLPSGWDVIASGTVTSDKTLYVIRNSIPQVDAAFVAAPSFEKVASGSFTVFYRDADLRTAVAVLEAAGNCGSYLNERYGLRNPLPSGALVLADRDGPAYARKNYIMLSRVDRDDSAGLHAYLCHELTHYWTRSAGSFSPDHWMTEAFAEYVASRYVRDHVSPAAFGRSLAQWEAVGRAHGPVWTPTSTTRPSFFVMYRRAPFLLALLEDRIGGERMDRLIQGYLVEGLRSTRQLLERLEVIAGSDDASWFRARLAERPQ